jgi:hypothetical protein
MHRLVQLLGWLVSHRTFLLWVAGFCLLLWVAAIIPEISRAITQARVSEATSKLVSFAVGGVLLGWVCFQYVGALNNTFQPNRPVRSVAPVAVIVDGKAATELGEPLARILLTSLTEVQE